MASPTYVSASLYVGDLASDVSEHQLYDIFSRIGPVVSIRVCRDATTQRSLGYAYVNFTSVSDAERALDTLNNTIVHNRPCRIMWSQRDPSLRKSGVGNIFIKGLDPQIDHKALHDTFSAFGNILSCKVALDENNNSKGYGFVHFDTQAGADKAIAAVDGMMLGGKIVTVRPFKSKKERLAAGEAVDKFTNVYVRNLADTVTMDNLKELFSQFGSITQAAVMNDEGKSKGFGFVNFANYEDAKKAIETMNGTMYEGKVLYCGRAQKKSERERELRLRVNLFVKNLDENVTEDVLLKEFSQFGQVTSVKVMKDDAGKSRGFGFVCFAKSPSASRAIAELGNKPLAGGSKPLFVTLAQSKDRNRGPRGVHPGVYHGAGYNNFAFGPYQPYPGGHMSYMGQHVMRNKWANNAPGSHNRRFQNRNQHLNANNAGAAGAGGNAPRGGPRRHNNAGNPNAQRQPRGGVNAQHLPKDNQQPQIDETAERNQLGEQLYYKVCELQPELAPKITGMLLSVSLNEVKAMLADQKELTDRVNEALEILKASEATAPAQ